MGRNTGIRKGKSMKDQNGPQTDDGIQLFSSSTKSPSTFSGLGRRSFLKRLSLGGAASLLPLAVLATSSDAAENGGMNSGGGLPEGDVAILRFLAAAEILETDLWQQYTEL